MALKTRQILILLGFLTVLTVALTAGALIWPQPAEAAFPGANGKIAFTSNRDGDTEIFVMNPDGTGVTQLTSNTAADSDPNWSPDGSKIAFRSNRDGEFEIFVMNADGTGGTQLTSNTTDDGLADWSPDGSKIAFQTDRDGNGEIYVMNADGSSRTNLTTNAASEGHPAYSPLGNRLTFISNRDGNFEIYVMDVDGSNPVNISGNVATDVVPNWQPLPNAATFQVAKDFTDDNPTTVTTSLACAGGTIIPVETGAAEGDPAEFTIDGLSGGETCTATETAGLPAGYTKDESACATVAITAASTSACTITNPTFQVLKNFSDNNTANVTVVLTCTSGTVTVDDPTAPRRTRPTSG